MKDLSIAMPASHLDAADSAGSSWHLPRLPQFKIPRFALHSASSTARVAVEDYIRQRFAQVHKAQVNHFLPALISLQCAGDYSAAVGLAPAAGNPLFAEQYLTLPVEQAIAQSLGLDASGIERRRIVEIGNLVSTWKGSSLLLFIFIGELMERLGYHYVMFTATREVKNLLARLHYCPVVLADADPCVLPDGGASWGSYYRHQPQVMFGDIRPAINTARKNPMYRATVAAISRQIDSACSEFRAHNLMQEPVCDE